jgi:hypothetical protein
MGEFMQGFLLFIFANTLYLLLGYGFSYIVRWLFPSRPESSPVRRSPTLLASLMTILSLLTVVLVPNKASLAPLGLPGWYAGVILSMLLTGNRHGPGDPYSWLLFAAPINFFFYYGIVRVVAKRFPSLL